MEKEEVQKREVFFRGVNLEELKERNVRESAKYLKSRQRRSVLRNFQEIERFIQRCEKRISKNKKIRTHLRDLIIVPKMVGMNIEVYNGKSFQNVHINHEMIGHRLGEFAPTRVVAKHTSLGTGATKSSKAKKK